VATPATSVRIPDELIDAVRATHPELAQESKAVIIRAALLIAAGIAIGQIAGELRGNTASARIPVPKQLKLST
jgi:hypothetical protein